MHKSVFISIIVAYLIASGIYGVLIGTGAEVLRYSVLLEVAIFLVPILFVVASENADIEKRDEALLSENGVLTAYNKPKTADYFQMHKFNPSAIVYLLWGLVGITLMELGIDTVIGHILPEWLMNYYQSMMRSLIDSQNLLMTSSSGSVLELLEIIGLIALVPAVCEEFLFRGYLMRNMLRSNSVGFSIIVSSLLFSLIHLSPVGLIPIFIIGVYLGLLYIKTKSIFPPIILHFCNNTLAIIATNYGEDSTDIKISLWLSIVLSIIGLAMIYISYRFMKARE